MHISKCANVWRVLQQLLRVCEKCESEKVSVSSVRLRTSLHLRLFVCILHRLSVLLTLGDQDQQKSGERSEPSVASAAKLFFFNPSPLFKPRFAI